MTVQIIPLPHRAEPRAGFLRIADGDVVVADPHLRSVAEVFIADVAADGGPGLTCSLTGTGRISVGLASDPAPHVPTALGVRADVPRDSHHGDERYRLEVDGESVRVLAATPEGAYRGLTSVRLLLAAGEEGRCVPHVRLDDGPRFAWRGLSVDVARTFHGPDTLRRIIDMCALNKLNVLHLHLTDDQGWRLEVPALPRLTTVGARGAIGDRPGGYYTVADMAGLVAYAAERFVTIVPEIDMPGHAAAAFRAYPELRPASATAIATGSGFDISVGTLDPALEATWPFVGAVLDEVVAQFPQSAYVHIGGDEPFGMADEDHAAFVHRMVHAVRARGKNVVGWQEIARADITSDEVVQYWLAGDVDPAVFARLPEKVRAIVTESVAKGADDLPRALAHGARILVSTASRAYFDAPHAAASSDPAQEEARARLGLPLYPPRTLRDGVEWDPVADTVGDADGIAGVEAAIWCETITDRDDLEFLLLPRLSGIAEKAWAAGPTSWPDYQARVATQARVWSHRGWNWFRSSEVDWPSR